LFYQETPAIVDLFYEITVDHIKGKTSVIKVLQFTSLRMFYYCLMTV